MWAAVEKNLLEDSEYRICNISKLTIPQRIPCYCKAFQRARQSGKDRDSRKEAIIAAEIEVGLMMTNAFVMEHSSINSPGEAVNLVI